jgi:hypothetical protein
MPEDLVLHRLTVQLDSPDRARHLEGGRLSSDVQEPVQRENGSPIRLEALRSLRDAFEAGKDSWRSPADSDRWLAPRLHSALRISRALAADRGTWHWLAVAEWADYVEWRWGTGSQVAENRWYGPVNKQALARLWWAGELFRDGDDYSAVEAAFRNQDLVNSLLHRPVVRCRSAAVGMIRALGADELEGLTSRRINDLARVLNLVTAGSPPEAQVGFQRDDIETALDWAMSDAPAPATWDQPLPGPAGQDTTQDSVERGIALARHGVELAQRRTERSRTA